ncbi:titin-like [Episyrphus balteatus]|uniref:titin-like n=1 Tax=Episyrphus balteatus TaxID=286459 RepID=UPI00248659FB|nr:titin-like [Episyrphus balteatus]
MDKAAHASESQKASTTGSTASSALLPATSISTSSLPQLTFSENSSSLVRCIPNERATFFVKIDCPDDPEILPLKFEWSRGELPIENSDRFRITQTSNAVQLAVEHVQREDAGHYTLYARTKAGNVIRKDVELLVEDRSTGDDPPIFLRRLGDLSVKVGTRTRLLVEIRSSTDVKITWYRNDRRICENDRIKQINEGSFYCIEITPVILEDGGQWMVMAENLGGRNSCIAHLNVLVPKAYKSPEFIEELRAVLTDQGTVSLECKVVGVPTPVLRWFKDSKEIKAGDVFALTANPDDPTSLGTYTCEAVNCMGKTYSSSKVHVVGRGSREGSLKPADSVQNNAPPPIFTNELRGTSVRIGDTIILGCQVVVPPWPKTVAWYNKEGRVEANDKYKLIEDGLGVYMIEIKPSESCDEGEWKCVVTSQEGCVGISSCSVAMDIPKNYRKPRFMESLKAVLTEEGLVSFECKVVGFPTPTLKWFKDGQELKPGDVYQLTGTNSLGTYCCIAKNCMGENSSVAVLTIEDIENQLNDEERIMFTKQNQPPKFVSGLKTQDAKINEPFRFTVTVKALPDPVLSWFRDELPIESNERYHHYAGEPETYHLDVKCVEFVDQAEWKCVAVNDFGTSVTSCFLKLQIPRHFKKPRFLECLRAVLTEEGAVNLECKVIGVPQPVLKWYKDGIELKPGDIHRIISGQDGTCCLGTYTCEARNCMGVVASSASLLGFEDAYKNQKAEPPVNELQRNFSLSTIQEERTSQMYESAVGDITIDEKGDISFSFDGKEVSVSLYETPDLTEEEALKIVEMYADQISEHVTEQNIVELPPLRFIKETSQSGNLLMEAVVIDIAPDYFVHEEDMRTEAGMDDISICEVTIHGSSGDKDEAQLDKETEEFAKKNIEKMEEELALTAPARKRKKSRGTEVEEYFSLSFSKASESQGDEDTSELQTFASASNQMTSSKIESLEMEENRVEEDVQPPKRKKDKKSPETDSAKTTEAEALLMDVSGAAGDGLQLLKPSKVVTDEGEIEKNIKSLLPLAKLLKTIETHLVAVESEVTSQSAMMMSPTSAEQSIGIIRNVLEPIKQIQGKMKVYSGEIPIEVLFQSMEGDIKALHTGLQVIEKCVTMDETGVTLIQRTSVCIIDSVGEQFVKTFEEVKNIANSFESEHIKMQTDITAEDIQQGIQITQDTIKSQTLLQEAQDIETAQHVSDSVAKLQTIPQTVPFDAVTDAKLPSEADSLKLICRPVIKIQQALENIENELSMEENEEELYSRVHETALLNLQGPIDELQLEVDKIEQKVVAAAGSETIEQKINMTILDIVSPPLFELKKGLEIISKQSAGNIHSGMMTVSAIESMVPPLQEIQNGLAQLGQDIEFGQVKEDFVPDSADTQKLLQSIAQGVLHFETNIERLSPRLSPNLQAGLVGLKDELSRLIGNILDCSLNKYRLTVLENLKTPIDELNYCLRQTEQKSISGSLSDLIDPIRSLREKVQLGVDILSISDLQQNDLNIRSLMQIKEIIKTIEIDIEEHEFKLLQKEIELDEKQATEGDQSFVSMREALSLQIAMEEGQKTVAKIEEIHECLATLENATVLEDAKTLTTENISVLKKMAKPVKEMLECVALIKSGAAFDTVEDFSTDVNVKVLQEIAEPINDLAEALKVITTPKVLEAEKSLSTQDDISALKTLAQPIQELRNCIAKLGQEAAFDEQVQSFEEQQAILKIAKPLNELQDCCDGFIRQAMVETMEDVSTLEDISALKTGEIAAEVSSQRTLLSQEDQPMEEIQNLELDNVKQLKAEALLTDLKQSLTSVVAFCSQHDVSSLKGETLNKLHATVTKLKDLEKCVAEVCEVSVREQMPSVSERTDPRTLAEAIMSLESCVVQVQDCLPEEGLRSLATEGLPISQLKVSALSAPLQELRECLQVFHTQEFENIDTFSVPKVSLVSREQVDEIIPFVVAVQENQALETLQSLIDVENLEMCKQIIAPIQQLQQAVLVQDQQHVSQVDNVSSQTTLATFAKPLMSLQEAIVNIQEQYPYSTFETCPEFKILKEKSNAIYQLLKYVEHVNCEALDNVAEMSTQADVSALETYAASLEGSEIMQASIQTEPKIMEPADMKACVEDGIKQIDSCLDKATFKKSKDLKEVEAVMKELKSSFQQMQVELSKESEGESSILAKSNIARTLFKLKECLVHTYEGGYEESLDDIEKTFEDILQALPELEVLLAEQMSTKVLSKISETVNISERCAEVHDAHVEFMKRLVVPFNELAADIERLGKSTETEVSKSSAQMIGLQSRLMNAFRALNEVSESVPNELLDHVLTGQSVLVSVFDFIEATESLRVIEVIQEIDNLLGPLSGINEILSQTLQKADGQQLDELLEPVKVAQELLTTVQEQLASGSELATKLATSNETVIQELQEKIEKIETEILVKENLSQLSAEEVRGIQSIGKPLEKLQESLVELANQQQMEMSIETTHKRKAEIEETIAVEKEEEQKQVPEKKSRLSESSPEKSIEEKPSKKEEEVKEAVVDSFIAPEIQTTPTENKSEEIVAEEPSTPKPLQEEQIPVSSKPELKKDEKFETLDLPAIKSQIGSEMFKSFESLRILKQQIVTAKDKKAQKASQELLSTLEITVCDIEKVLLSSSAETVEDTLFLPLFKMRDLLAFIKQNPETNLENEEILAMTNKVFVSILNNNAGLRRAFLQDLIQTPKDGLSNIIPLLEESQGLETCRSLLTVVQKLDSTLNVIVTKNEGSLGRSSEAFINLRENLKELRSQAEELGKRLPSAFKQTCVEPIVKICEAIEDSKTEDAIEVLQEMEALKGPLKVLKETIAKNIKNFKESQELAESLKAKEEKVEQVSMKDTKKSKEEPDSIKEEKATEVEPKTAEDQKPQEEEIVEKEVEKPEKTEPKKKKAKAKKETAEIEEINEAKMKAEALEIEKLEAQRAQLLEQEKIEQKKMEDSKKEIQISEIEAEAKKADTLTKEIAEVEEISETKKKSETKDIEKPQVEEAKLLEADKIEQQKLEESAKQIQISAVEAESKKAETLMKETAEIEEVSETIKKAEAKEIEKLQAEEAKLLEAQKIKEQQLEESKKEITISAVEEESKKAETLMKETAEIKEVGETTKKAEAKEIEKQQAEEATLLEAEKIQQQQVEESKKELEIKKIEAESKKAELLKKETAETKEVSETAKEAKVEDVVKPQAEEGKLLEAERIEQQQVEESKKEIKISEVEAESKKAETLMEETAEIKETSEETRKAEAIEIEKPQAEEAKLLEAEKIVKQKLEESKKEMKISAVEEEAKKAEVLTKETAEIEEVSETAKTAEVKQVEKPQSEEAKLLEAEKIEQQKLEESKKELEIKKIEAESKKAELLQKETAELEKVVKDAQKIETKEIEKSNILEAQLLTGEKVEEQQVEDSSKKIEIAEIEASALAAEKSVTEPEKVEKGKVSLPAQKIEEQEVEGVKPLKADVTEAHSEDATKLEASEEKIEATSVPQEPMEITETVSEVDTISIAKTLEVITNLSEDSEAAVAIAMSELNDLNDELAAGANDDEKLLQSVRKAYFKLRECIVHTYDGSKASDDEEEANLQVIDEAFKNILDSNPFVRNQISNELMNNAAESIEKLKKSLSERSSEKLPKELGPLLQHLGVLKESIEMLMKSDDDSFEKASNKMISLQTCLMETFFKLDDLASNQDNKDVKAALVNAQEIVLKIHDHFDVPQQIIPKIKISEDLSRLSGPMERILKLLGLVMAKEEEMIVESKEEESKLEALEESEKVPEVEKQKEEVKEKIEIDESQKLENDQQVVEKISEVDKTKESEDTKPKQETASLEKMEVEVKEVLETEPQVDKKKKGKIAEVPTEVAEEKKVEDAKKDLQVEEITVKKSTAEISKTEAEKIEKRKIEDSTRKSSIVDIKTDEPHVAKIAEIVEAESAIVPDAKKSLEIVDVTLEGKVAEKSVTEPEVIIEKKIDSTTQKLKEEEIALTKQKAEKSVTEAEKIVEEKLSEDLQKVEVSEDVPLTKTAEKSEIKAEKIEEKTLEAKKIEAEITEALPEAQSAEKSVTEPLSAELEEMKVTDLKPEVKEIKTADSQKAEVSEIKLEKIEKDEVIDNKSATEIIDVSPKSLVARKSITEPEEVKIETLSDSAKQKKEEEIKSPEVQVAESSEVKLEEIEKKTIEENKMKISSEEVKPEKLVAEKSKTKADRVQVETISDSLEKVKVEDVKAPEDQEAEISEVKLEKIEKLSVEDNKVAVSTQEVTPEKQAAKKSITKPETVKVEEQSEDTQKAIIEDVPKTKGQTSKVDEIKPEVIEKKTVEDSLKKLTVSEVTLEAQEAQKSTTKAETLEVVKLSEETQKLEVASVSEIETKKAEISGDVIDEEAKAVELSTKEQEALEMEEAKKLKEKATKKEVEETKEDKKEEDALVKETDDKKVEEKKETKRRKSKSSPEKKKLETAISKDELKTEQIEQSTEEKTKKEEATFADKPETPKPETQKKLDEQKIEEVTPAPSETKKDEEKKEVEDKKLKRRKSKASPEKKKEVEEVTKLQSEKEDIKVTEQQKEHTEVKKEEAEEQAAKPEVSAEKVKEVKEIEASVPSEKVKEIKEAPSEAQKEAEIKEDEPKKIKRRKSKASPEKKKEEEKPAEIVKDDVKSTAEEDVKTKKEIKQTEEEKLVEEITEKVPEKDKPEQKPSVLEAATLKKSEEPKEKEATQKEEEDKDTEEKKIKRRKSKASPEKKKEEESVSQPIKDDQKTEKKDTKTTEETEKKEVEKVKEISQVSKKEEDKSEPTVAEKSLPQTELKKEEVKTFKFNVLKKIVETVQDSSSITKEIKSTFANLTKLNEQVQAQPSDENLLRTMSESYLKLREQIVKKDDSSSTKVTDKKLVELKTSLIESLEPNHVLKKYISNNIMKASLSEMETLKNNLMENSSKKSTKVLVPFIEPLSNLQTAVESLTKSEEDGYDKSSGRMVNLQSCLMDMYFSCDDIKPHVDEKLSKTIQNIMKVMLQVHDKVENASESVDRVVMSESIDDISIQIQQFAAILKSTQEEEVIEEEKTLKKLETKKKEEELEEKKITKQKEEPKEEELLTTVEEKKKEEVLEEKKIIKEKEEPMEEKPVTTESVKKVEEKLLPEAEIDQLVQKKPEEEPKTKPDTEDASKTKTEKVIKKKSPSPKTSPKKKKTEDEPKPVKEVTKDEDKSPEAKPEKVEESKKTPEEVNKPKEEPVPEAKPEKTKEKSDKLEPSVEAKKTEKAIEDIEDNSSKLKKDKKEETKAKPKAAVLDVDQQKTAKADLSDVKTESIEDKKTKEPEKATEKSDVETKLIETAKAKIPQTETADKELEVAKKKEEEETKKTAAKKPSPKKKVTKKETVETKEEVVEPPKSEEEPKKVEEEIKPSVDKSEPQIVEKAEKEAVEIPEEKTENTKKKEIEEAKPAETKKPSPKKKVQKKEEEPTKQESEEKVEEKTVIDKAAVQKSSEDIEYKKPEEVTAKKSEEQPEILEKPRERRLKTEVAEETKEELEDKPRQRTRTRPTEEIEDTRTRTRPTEEIEDTRTTTYKTEEIEDTKTRTSEKTEIIEDSVEIRPTRLSRPTEPVKTIEPSSHEIRERKKESKRAPNFDLKLTNRNSPLGSDIKLTCCISGSDVSVQWFKDKTPINQDSKHSLSYVDGLSSLEIRSVEKTDSGIYRCIATNRNGDIETSCLVSVYEVPTAQSGTPPIFTRNIRDTYQSQRNQIILECKVSGNPKPNIFWQKDNVLLEFPSEKYQLVELLEGIKQLIIANPNGDDSGLYTCYAESIGGQMKLSKFLDVTDHIKVRKEEKNQEKSSSSEVEKVVVEDGKERAVKTREAKRKLKVEASLKNMVIGSGNKAQLLCNVSGPIDEVQWYKDGERIFKDNRHKIYNINGTLSLEIYDATTEDSGDYSCIARNGQHQAENKCSLSIYDSKQGYNPPQSFDSAIRESFDAHRNEIILECNVHGRPRITWLKDDHIISNNRYRQFEEAGGLRRLVIRNPISSDFGSFSCYAETDDQIEAIAVTLRAADLKKMQAYTNGHVIDNSSTTDDSYKQYRSSDRDYEDEYSHQSRSAMKASSCGAEVRRKPVFSMLLNDRTVLEGSHVKLSCNVVGGCEISWLKNHDQLPSSSRYQKLFHNGQATLEIFSAEAEDSGNYACRAFNEYGEVFSYAQVKVFQSYDETPQPPTFVRYMKGKKVLLFRESSCIFLLYTYSLNEDELVLDCRVRGHPRPEIQWMKESDMISADSKYRPISLSDGYCKLIINNPTEKDAGVYSCVARNSVKEEKITHQVDFKGKDRAALEKTHGFFHRDPNKPHLQNPLGNHTVTPGGTIAIMAEFLPTSSPIDVQWFRSREPLAGQPNVKTFFDHGVYTLAISNAASEWEGAYTCRATNAYGRLETNAYVDIADKGGKASGPPLFLSRPDSEMKIAVGDPFSISFRLQGEPKPKLTLLKGTKDITKTDRVSKEASDDYIRFTVQKSTPSDSGTYFVVARNEFGTDRVFVTITVLQRARSATPTSRWGQPLESFPDTSYFRDPPGPISTEPTVIDAGKSHISLSWGKPQSENSAPVIAYRVDAWIVGKEGGAMWKEIGMTPINSFDAFNLLPNCEYHFRVTPKNRYGWGPSVQTRSPVQVGGAECLPEFVKILPGQTKALLEKQCSLECVVQGAPRPRIVWYKDGLQIESSDRVRIKQYGSVCTLLISQVFDIDSGRYTCEATNSKGRVSTFARLQVVSDEKLYAADHKLKELITSDNVAALGETIPIFTMRLRDRRVQVTYPVRLTCQVMGYPRPEITWYKGDDVVEESRRTVITDDGQFITLEITSTKLDDSGTYTCTARNELGSVSCHCSLFVDKGIRAYISPDFYMPLEPLYVFKEGEEIRLTAKVEAYPSVGVSWHRNGAKLRPSRRILTTLDSNGFVELIIAEATQKDAGIYVCAASNAVGKVETSTRVTVEEVSEEERKKMPTIRASNLPYSKEPLFVVKPRSSEAYEGDTVIIFCEVIGDPKPDVVWLRDFLKHAQKG